MTPIAKASLAAVVLASFGVWIFGWLAQSGNTRIDLRTGEERTNAPDLFDNSTLSIDAEALCSKVLAEIGELAISSDATSPQDRAQPISEATSLYQELLVELAELEPDTERDELIWSGWLSDWDQIIDDRIAYTEGLDAGRDEPFTISDRGGTERIDRRITRLAVTNEMPSCQFPTDLGG